MALLTGAAGWWIVHSLVTRGFNWCLVAHTVTGLRWSWLVVALIPVSGTYFWRALRWGVML